MVLVIDVVRGDKTFGIKAENVVDVNHSDLQGDHIVSCSYCVVRMGDVAVVIVGIIPVSDLVIDNARQGCVSYREVVCS